MKMEEEILSLYPSYVRGELTPSQAHRVSQWLREENEAPLEAARELLVVDTLSQLPIMKVPHGLIERSVSLAVGEPVSGRWFSLDTLLLSLGVGMICALISRFFSGWITILPHSENLLIDLSKLVSGSSGVSLFLGFWGISALMLVGGVWLALRSIRT